MGAVERAAYWWVRVGAPRTPIVFFLIWCCYCRPISIVTDAHFNYDLVKFGLSDVILR